MEMNKTALTWNLGDTSFRRKKLLDDYRELIRILNDINIDFDNAWERQGYIQMQYYRRVVKETDLLEKEENNKGLNEAKQAQRGRTYTSGLYKIGLCNKGRTISDIGKQFLGLKPFEMDELEQKLLIKKDNIIFLRQLLKLNILDNSSNRAFNPFIFLIKLLNRYETLTKEQFKLLLHLANGSTNYTDVIEKFELVVNGTKKLGTFIEEYMIRDTNSEEKEEFINSNDFNEELFYKVFINGKTADSVKIYKDFYFALINYNNDNNRENLKTLVELIRNNVIKKAFGSNKIFDIGKINTMSVNQFNAEYINTGLINKTGKNLREIFTETFLLAKQEDLIREYVDMTFRVFNLSGIISFKNDKVTIDKLYAKEYFKAVDSSLNPIVEHNEEVMYEIKSINEILGVNKVSEVDRLIYHKYHLEKAEDVNSFVKNKEVESFNIFIEDKFKRENVISILEDISARNDENVFKKVTDQTTVPTIFEFILGIAWYHISEGKFNLYDSLNLTLDSDFYPLTHAGGGEGDIVINYDKPNHCLMLEATLMDCNTQKRGELEPVIRHTTNLTVENSDIDTYTIFVANELDNNVINIFRFCDLIKLESSKNRGNYTVSTKILALTIGDIIELLNNNIKYDKVYNAIRKEFEIKDIGLLNRDWRTRFKSNIYI